MHTCTGFLLNTWNASALIDKNLRNFLVSMFSSSSACFTYGRGGGGGEKLKYEQKWNGISIAILGNNDLTCAKRFSI